MSRKLPFRPSLRYLQEEAKDLLKAHSRGEPKVVDILQLLDRFKGISVPTILTSTVSLHEVQLALALDYGFSSWPRLIAHVKHANERRNIIGGMMKNAYDQVAKEYAALENGTEWPRLRWVRKVIGLLPEGSAVLDLGCGSGDPADIAIAKKHIVTGVDVSQTQIVLARRNVPSGCFIRADMANIDFKKASFDAVICCYIIEHIPRREHAAFFERIADWLKPGGYLLITSEEKEYNDETGTWLGVKIFLSNYGPKKMKMLVTDAGFVIREDNIESQLEGGNEIRYLWILAQLSDKRKGSE